MLYLCVLFWLPIVVQVSSTDRPDGKCDDRVELLQGRVQLAQDSALNNEASSFQEGATVKTYSEDDLDLDEVQVRRAPPTRPWSFLQQQRPTAIHYEAVGKASKRHVRVCFILVNTLASPHERFGKDKKFRHLWESAFPTPRELGDLFFKHSAGAAKFLNEASYGKVAVSGTVVGWYNATGTGWFEEHLSADDMFKDRDRYFLLARNAVKLEDYDIFTLVGLAPKGKMQRGFDMTSDIVDPDCKGSYKKCLVAKDIGMTFMINAGIYKKTRMEGNPFDYAGMLPSKAWAHEIIHALGSYGHDNGLLCGNSPLADQCDTKTYANQFSVMGKSNWAQHPSCQSMEHIGWLHGEEIAEVTVDDLDDADVTVKLTPRSIAGGGLKCVKVILAKPISMRGKEFRPFDVLWIDHRQASGFDASLGWLDESVSAPYWSRAEQWTGRGRAIRKDGVLLTLASTPTKDSSSSFRRRRFAYAQSQLLDVHAESLYRDDLDKISACKGKFADATLLADETLRCEQLALEVQVLSVDTAGARVKLRRNTKLEGCPSPTSSNAALLAEEASANLTNQQSQGGLAAEMHDLEESTVSPSTCRIVSVSVVADRWIRELSWTIEDPSGSTWLSGKGPESLSSQSDCAELVGDYSFTINDVFGDGLCCQHGNGSYVVKVDDAVVASGGQFGRSESTVFSIL